MPACPVCRCEPANACCGVKAYIPADCPICLEEKCASVIVLPCGHAMCTECFPKWGGTTLPKTSGSAASSDSPSGRRSSGGRATAVGQRVDNVIEDPLKELVGAVQHCTTKAVRAANWWDKQLKNGGKGLKVLMES